MEGRVGREQFKMGGGALERNLATAYGSVGRISTKGHEGARRVVKDTEG